MAIFGKDQQQQQPAAKPVVGRVEVESHHTSVLGPNLMFDGTITGKEQLLIEGAVKGAIDLQSDLRVAKGATIEATVHAANIIIEGTVIGDVSADRRIELVATARVDGNIRAPKIVVAEGARFRGAVDMGSTRPKESE